MPKNKNGESIITNVISEITYLDKLAPYEELNNVTESRLNSFLAKMGS